MNLNLLISLVIAFVLLQSCSKPMTDEQKITMLENQRLEILADLYRQQSECQAKAIEFVNLKNGQEVVESCMAAYRVMAESSNRIVTSIEKRILEINRSAPNSRLLTDDQVFGTNMAPTPSPFDEKLNREK